MKMNKLFQVLVVGGALVSTGVVANETDSGGEVSEPKVAFCIPANEEMCEQDISGNWQVKEGFACCWGTTCAPE